MNKKRIAILTSGGDCPGLNAAIFSLSLSAIKQNYEVFGIKWGFEGLLNGGDYIILDRNTIGGIKYRGGSILKSTTKGHFPGKIGKGELNDIDKKYLNEAKSFIVDNYIEYLVVIGGDGSFAAAKQLEDTGVKLICIPKTIDNDVLETDYTIGFNTSVEIVKSSLHKIHSTAETHGRIFITELMGRDAGWLALYGGVAGSAHQILIPERKFNYNSIIENIENRYSSGYDHVLIAISEGINFPDIDNSNVEISDSSMHQYGGAGKRLESKLDELLNGKRVTKSVAFEHIQRGGEPNAFDFLLATKMGAFAFELILKQKSGVMVAIKNNKIVDVPLENVCKGVKHVTPNDDLIKTAKLLGIYIGEEI